MYGSKGSACIPLGLAIEPQEGVGGGMPRPEVAEERFEEDRDGMTKVAAR